VALLDELKTEVAGTFTGDNWDEQDATVVPTVADLTLSSNHAKNFKSATVLYADLDGSTNMVDNYKWWFSAQVYKAYLRCAGKIIRNEGGVITAYDGDRIMAVFIGGTKNTSAVRAALKINHAVTEIINPAIKAKHPNTAFVLKHVIGIDTSPLRAVRIGVHRDNDLVWVGRAANYAAKLCNDSSHSIWITSDVYEPMLDTVTTYKGTNMWAWKMWPDKPSMKIYGSSWRFKLDFDGEA
jgi:class 3 adenylate cyclase